VQSSDCCRTCKALRSARLNDDLAASKPNMTAITRLMSNRMSVVTIAAKRGYNASRNLALENCTPIRSPAASSGRSSVVVTRQVLGLRGHNDP
jgi:hypothetical protein